jgi:beta-N-acetylhexosaminidase
MTKHLEPEHKNCSVRKKSVLNGLLRDARVIQIAAWILIAVLVITQSGVSFAQQKAKPDVSAFQSRPIKPFRRTASTRALRWAESQTRQMSLDEKIGQLISIGVNGRYLPRDSEAYRDLMQQIERNHIGGIVLFRGSVYESVHLTNAMQRLSRYPLLVSADMEFGAAMRFDDTASIPWNMAVCATGKVDYARRQGEVIAQEARALGVRQVFGPVADVNNNPANPIINVRAYSEDPMEVARFSSAFIEGAQTQRVIATAKHFPGHGDTAIDSHRGLPIINVSRARLNQTELVPFRAAIALGVGSVMASFIALPQIDPTDIKPLSADRTSKPSDIVTGDEIVVENATLPAALSPLVMQGILRNDLHFDGLIVTDALDMSGLTIYFNQGEAAVRAVEAGADMLIKPGDPDAAVQGLRQAVLDGRIPKERIDKSVRRILAAKYDLGLVQDRYIALERVDQTLSNSQVISFAKEVAEHAITLVRNDAHLMPVMLRPNAKVFNLAITNGDDRSFIAKPFVEEMARLGTVMDTVVLDARSTEQEISHALNQAQNADLVVVSLYGRVRAGEALSSNLPASSVDLLTQLINKKLPVIGISFGNPYTLQTFPELRTYMVAYGDMPSLQKAAAGALLNRIDITGRLPITLPSLYPRGTGIQLKAATTQNQ